MTISTIITKISKFVPKKLSQNPNNTISQSFGTNVSDVLKITENSSLSTSEKTPVLFPETKSVKDHKGKSILKLNEEDIREVAKIDNIPEMKCASSSLNDLMLKTCHIETDSYVHSIAEASEEHVSLLPFSGAFIYGD
jgi:hypothetical protein